MAKRILILEDDQATLELCMQICSELGLEVISNKTTLNILEQVREVKPDIILMDNWIPGYGGQKSIELLKQTDDLKHIPILFFSANSDFRKVALVTPADDNIEKPFDLEDLERKIKNLLKE